MKGWMNVPGVRREGRMNVPGERRKGWMNVPGVRREGRMDVDVGTVDESDNVISATRRRSRDVYELSRVEVGRTLITLIK